MDLTSAKERRTSNERRNYPRYACSGWAKLRKVNESKSETTGELTDISLGGFYLQTFTPWPVDASVEVTLGDGTIEITGIGLIKTLHPAMGNGIEFTELTDENRKALDALIEKVSKSAAPQPQETQPRTPQPTAPPVKLYPPLEALFRILERKALITREEFLRELSALEKSAKDPTR